MSSGQEQRAISRLRSSSARRRMAPTSGSDAHRAGSCRRAARTRRTGAVSSRQVGRGHGISTRTITPPSSTNIRDGGGRAMPVALAAFSSSPSSGTSHAVVSIGYGRTGKTSQSIALVIRWKRTDSLGSRIGVGSAVIGRVCRMNRFPWAQAHSMSCGRPKCRSMSLATPTSCRTAAAGRAASARRPVTCSVPPPGRGRTAISRRPTLRRTILPRRVSTTMCSGETSPETPPRRAPGSRR